MCVRLVLALLLVASGGQVLVCVSVYKHLPYRVYTMSLEVSLSVDLP